MNLGRSLGELMPSAVAVLYGLSGDRERDNKGCGWKSLAVPIHQGIAARDLDTGSRYGILVLARRCPESELVRGDRTRGSYHGIVPRDRTTGSPHGISPGDLGAHPAPGDLTPRRGPLELSVGSRLCSLEKCTMPRHFRDRLGRPGFAHSAGGRSGYTW